MFKNTHFLKQKTIIVCMSIILEILEGGISKKKPKQTETSFFIHYFLPSPLTRKKQRAEIVTDFGKEIRK